MKTVMAPNQDEQTLDHQNLDHQNLDHQNLDHQNLDHQNLDDQTLALAHARGVLRARDLEEHGIARTYLRRLQERGLLVPLGRGLYLPGDAEVTEHQSLIEVARRVPHGVVCLLSALRFHDFTTLEPHQVWLAIESRARTPKLDYPPLRVMRFSGDAWHKGVEEHALMVGKAKVMVRVTSPAKTVADCWKFRSKVGQDVALEALRDGWQGRKFTMDELWHYAKVNRVANVMRPYLEAVTFSCQ
jgi:predicted transcriptional regulator of viral defense system